MQVISNLVGQSENPTILTGAFMNEEEVTTRFGVDGKNLALPMTVLFKLVLSVYMHDFEGARSNLAKFKRIKAKSGSSPPMQLLEFFYGAIALLSMDKPKVRKVKASLRWLRRCRRYAPCLFTGKICLVEAELAAVRQDWATAWEKFELSIAVAQRETLVNEQAFACERAALFMKSSGKMVEAARYFDEARVLYQKWGCYMKVRHLDQISCSSKKNGKPVH